MHGGEPGSPAALRRLLEGGRHLRWAKPLAPTVPNAVERHPESLSVALRPPSEPPPYVLKPTASCLSYRLANVQPPRDGLSLC